MDGLAHQGGQKRYIPVHHYEPGHLSPECVFQEACWTARAQFGESPPHSLKQCSV